ncbi:hypothetical protein [Aurantiacibacter sp. D1-12]|uniref:hypothetical protein n=1 Tax=Aurantiacibacter sp. D1-12 TaxID=2993658 RepID=UPI00237C93F0|nr:hypothetical protein [Aurantiacibacter sp. D1-12]MDE1466722.1 hypothetical protein [Aurantiacibacter sp. D1-12]
MYKKFYAFGAAAALLGVAAMPAPAAAQDVSADPIYETVELVSGFTPDPYYVSLRSGGVNNARDLGGECRGYVATSPDVRLFFEAGSLPLIISAASEADITLVINAPDGSWYCDDDSGPGLDPQYVFDPAMSGRYEIWVGTYSSSDTHDATLAISELYGGDGEMITGSGQTAMIQPSASGPDVNADPIYETVNLSAGFVPDPYLVNLQSGGVNDATGLGDECRGYIANAPDVRLNYEAGTVPLYISVDSMADTTLVVNAPNGQWYCNDDGGEGLNPSISFNTPLSGRYEIWVGTYGGTDNNAAELNISELYSE